MKRRTTILTVVSSAIAEAGIKALAASIPEWDVAVETATAVSAPEAVARLRPSLLITEPITLTPTDLSAIREASGDRMRVAVLYLSALPSKITAHYDTALSIYASPDKLRQIIGEAASKALDSGDSAIDNRRELSPREKDVVVGVVRGLSNKEIAEAIGVSVNTVTTHRRNIASKLKIHSPAGLTIYAIVSKLVTLDEVAV